MRRRKRIGIIVAVLVLAGAALAAWGVRYARNRTTVVHGAVITASRDPRKRLPVAGVEITATDGFSVVRSTSDSSGLFVIRLRKRLFRGRVVSLRFRHMDYEPLELVITTPNPLYVAEMTPIRTAQEVLQRSLATQTISNNVVVRYSIKTAAVANIASMVRTLEVENKGGEPCSERPPCSPDGRWKASSRSLPLDAGSGNVLRNFRASCIAGPCPFTRIEPSDLAQAGTSITVTATVWSDTATFLVEAEIAHPMVSDLVRTSYPVVFGDALNFTLPPAAEGVSLQAELNGESIVFPLGPALRLSWADCGARTNPDQTRVYRCTLKPGFRWLHATT